jgi:hypothetical protein
MKRNSSDPVPDIEGKGKNANWIAADLGKKFEFFKCLFIFLLL